MATILLVDDEKLPMAYYVKALVNKGFEVKQFLSPDSAFEFINKVKPKIDAIIIDIMIFPGEKYKDVDTQEGLITGTFLYKDLERIYPNVPVIVLTNVTNEETLDKLNENELLKVVQKLDYPPFAFADLVNEMINKVPASTKDS